MRKVFTHLSTSKFYKWQFSQAPSPNIIKKKIITTNNNTTNTDGIDQYMTDNKLFTLSQDYLFTTFESNDQRYVKFNLETIYASTLKITASKYKSQTTVDSKIVLSNPHIDYFSLGGKLITDKQCTFLNQVLDSKNSHSFNQAIMGIGKSSVILPCLIIHALTSYELEYKNIVVVQPEHLVRPALEIVMKTLMVNMVVPYKVRIYTSIPNKPDASDYVNIFILSDLYYKQIFLQDKIDSNDAMKILEQKTFRIFDEID
jgi:hypothetical protein